MTGLCIYILPCLTFLCSLCGVYGTNLCGTPTVQPLLHKIVGGRPSTQQSLPWMAMLKELDEPACGGSIIAENLILTAAHCFEDPESQNTARWKVYVGKYHAHKTDTTESVHYVQRIIMHEAYNSDTVANDIAILVLRNRITYSTAIQPICLPSNKTVTVGQVCLSAGWGATMGTGSSGILNQVPLPVLDSRTCMRSNWYGSDFLPSITFCAGYQEGGKDSCSGDSGGPLICKFGGRKWFQMGIISWGYECARPRWPGIYTNVTKYEPWIKSKALGLGVSL